MKTHPERSTACPLAAVDKRLSDAHRLWHQADRDYFDPDGFRLAAQNTIQTLRTVTFILQKNKRVVPEFEGWYGHNPVDVMGRRYDSYADLAAGYFDLARLKFMRDGYHVSMLLLFRQQKPVRIIQLRTENVQQKYLLMRELTHEVVKAGADAAIMIGEVWTVSAEKLKPYERAADSPERREVLTLSLVTQDGDPLEFMAMIERSGQTVSLSETQRADNTAPFAFAPFYRAWGRAVPDSWITMSRAILQRGRRGTS